MSRFPRIHFAVERYGVDIREYPLRNNIYSGIKAHYSFWEWEAGVTAGLDMWLWESGGYPGWFKSKVLAWFNMHNKVESHQQDAVNRYMENKAKRKGKF